MAAALGVDFHTVNRLCRHLRANLFVRRLQPYFVNIGQTARKRPKSIFEIADFSTIFSVSSMKLISMSIHKGVLAGRGSSSSKLVTKVELKSPKPEAFFWRTTSGTEVDLVLKRGAHLDLFEIKLHSSPTLEMVSSLPIAMKDLGVKEASLSILERFVSLGAGVTAVSAAKIFSDPESVIGSWPA